MSKFKLDNMDHKILYELDKNSRASYAAIAKTLQVSKQTIKNRLNKLIENKVISQFITIINMANFGSVPYKVFISLRNTTEDDKQRIEGYLLENPAIGTFAFCDGPFDLYLGISSDSLQRLDFELSKFYHLFSNFIKSKKAITLVDTKIYPRDYLIGKERDFNPQNKPFHAHEFKPVPVKEIDQEIMRLLTKDARMPLTKIAELTNTSLQTIMNRLKYLEKNHVIVGYGLWVSHNYFVQYKILVELSTNSAEIEKKMVNYATSHPNVSFVVKTFGEWDYEFVVEGKNLTECREFIANFKKEFSPHLKSFLLLMFNEMPKMNFLPRFKE